MADVKDASRRIVFTGAAGGIGTMIRPLLAPLSPGLELARVAARFVNPATSPTAIPYARRSQGYTAAHAT